MGMLISMIGMMMMMMMVVRAQERMGMWMEM
jgi:hypothetical protein